MRNKILALAAISSLFMFGACSDDSSPSLEDKCSGGLSADCLEGTWNLMSISNKEGTMVISDYSTNPGILTIKDNGEFEYLTSNSPSSDMTANGCGGVKEYGTWNVNDAAKTVTFKFTVTDCHTFNETHTIKPAINATDMNLNGVVFQSGDLTDANTKDVSTEMFKRAAD